MEPVQRLRILVTVKAYPSISTRHNELVCCAGVTEDHQWVRLYPITFRELPEGQQFKKYDIIEVDVQHRPEGKDDRPESFMPLMDTMKIVDHLDSDGKFWEERAAWIEPTVIKGYAEMLRLQETENRSLGAFRPACILGPKIIPNPEPWSDKQLAQIAQMGLFSDKEPLEKVAWRFQVGFVDEIGKEHCLSIEDWEIFQLWRGERDRHGEAKAVEQVRKKLEQMLAAERDPILFVGNQGDPRKRKSFMILGIFWPKRNPQPALIFG